MLGVRYECQLHRLHRVSEVRAMQECVLSRTETGVVSSLPCPQGKRPCRIKCASTADGERAGTLLDRLALPRDKSGVDAYYTKLASAAVIKSGARWFVDARPWGRNTRWQLEWW